MVPAELAKELRSRCKAEAPVIIRSFLAAAALLRRDQQ
jgi:hypothetical protein